MASETRAGFGEAIFIHKAFKNWFISASMLVLILSAVIYFGGLGANYAAYASSLINFICGIFAGAAAQRARGGGAVYTGLLTGLAITIALLTVGFAIAGSALGAAGIISVTSFSLAGACCGSVFFAGRADKKKIHSTGPKMWKKRN